MLLGNNLFQHSDGMFHFDLTCLCERSITVKCCRVGSKAEELVLEQERMNSKLTRFIKEEGILILLHVLRGSGLIQEQRVNPFDVLHLNFCPLKNENTQMTSTVR